MVPGHGAPAPPFPQAQYQVAHPAAVPVQYQVPVQPFTYTAPPVMQHPQQMALAPIEYQQFPGQMEQHVVCRPPSGSLQMEQKMDAYNRPKKILRGYS